ncbi:MAG: ANTAR domain-containing protein [Oscillospiraceae bacterium]|jgi:response regulator NasT|nr:ANTAR domain-containing protein [Oscillospiraceae bacterium]
MMKSVLVAAQGQNSAETLRVLLRDRYKNAEILAAGSGAIARRLIDERCPELLVISSPLPDESGEELARFVARSSCQTGVLLLSAAEHAEEISDRAGADGVFVLEKPFTRAFFNKALSLLEAFIKRTAELNRQNAELLVRIEEQGLIGRAKCNLVKLNGFTELEAHRYIEKRAMDLRLTKRRVAEEILRGRDWP